MMRRMSILRLDLTTVSMLVRMLFVCSQVVPLRVALFGGVQLWSADRPLGWELGTN